MAGVRPVRMEDIAAKVGVSRTAVSFVLNNRADASISEVTRTRIIQVANELGYRPHAGARRPCRPALWPDRHDHRGRYQPVWA